MALHADCQGPIADQHSQFDVAVETGFGEIGGSDEYRLLVGNDRLHVKHARRTVRFERPGV